MDPWSIGLAALVVLGLAAVVFGALYDRARNRRRHQEMLAPPARVIPRFRPDAPSPHYLSDLQARRPPTGAAPTAALSAAERTAVNEQLADQATPSVPAGYASAEFVTDPTARWVVLDQPVVCVCADEVASIRELLGLLERLVLSRTPLVLVAPAVAKDVLGTLEVNRIQQRLSVVVVLLPEVADRERVAQLCGGRPTDRSDRQAGYLPPEDLGRCERWVSTARSSHVLTRRTATA
ncbi:hypothetical protein [uncultured Friedmanniella sp.]|uniref:hypothetical protein n=1 Tax=uncultured Friedmanniella sp. TaxID=335381 RepID=UPI0035C94479